MAADGNTRGSIAFFTTYRPPLPLDIFSCPIPTKDDELPMTDGQSYNYNGHFIPSTALKTILMKSPKLASKGIIFRDSDVDSGQLLGIVFVSERDNLETLHIALLFRGNTTTTPVVDQPKVQVFSLAQVFGTTEFTGVRMEDSGCFSSDYIFYVTTKDPAPSRRQPWTAVYKTHLITGNTERLTPPGQADLNPSVSPSGKMIAVASFEAKKGGWDGEIEDLRTNIFVMNIEKPFDRKLVVRNGGWPTWGSDNIIFFHRKVGMYWGVFRANIRKAFTPDIARVTPDGIHAMTPAAINSTTVAVATIREKSQFDDARVAAQYRHIEIFHSSGLNPSIRITQKTRPKADHFNPFVIDGKDGKRIGYHRCKSDVLKSGDDIPRQFNNLRSPADPVVGLFRVSGVFPTFSKDGSKLAFVDNEFKALWIADSKGLRVVYSTKNNNLFSPVWNQNPDKDTLYVCVGPAFNAKERLDICAIKNLSKHGQQRIILTKIANNAFPSTNPDGTKLVFRSTRAGGKYKNLYIMEDAEVGEYGDGQITRLTIKDCTDTQCQWSPRGDWIVFSSNRDKPPGSPPDDNGLDPGYFAVYLVKWNDSTVVVRVVASGDNIAGHVNHPFFSPDGKSIVVSADLAAVSVDPVSLPLFVHSVRPYGDIFTVDIIDLEDIKKNENVKNFTRITHSRYENSTASWTHFSTQNPNAYWNLQPDSNSRYTPTCPYAYPDGGESWHMTGHLCIPKRAC